MEHLKLKNNLLITANIIFLYVDIHIGENYLIIPPKENMKMMIETLVLNSGTAHKKVESISDAFKEGGIIIFDTQTREYKSLICPRQYFL
jgi:hypothetical protein